MELITRLRDPQTRRSKATQRIAAVVLQDPGAVLTMPIAALARLAGVSEPSVNRFCTGLGLKGFPDFKIKLAAELARREPGLTRDVALDDAPHQIADKIFDATISTLQATRQLLDDDQIVRAVAMLDSAGCIALCGQGASASVAADAQHKLMIFGAPVSSHADPIMQRMAVDSLGASDCLVCISYTGRTVSMIELAALARSHGVPVLGITTPGSGVAANCDLVLPVAQSEDTDTYMPMSSRIAQLAVIDVLVTALAVRRGPEFSRRLRELKKSVIATRRPEADKIH